MIKPISLVTALGMALSACQPAIPDSGRGAGFDDFQAQQSQRDAALAAPPQGEFPAPSAVSASALSAPNDGSAAATAAETARILDATRPGGLGNDAATDAGPNIVSYALQNKHGVGTAVYTRRGLNKERKFVRACAEYSHPDQAQIAFLSAGGPERDRAGMDPDGDGYACDWDPSPYRRAIEG